MTYSKYGMIIPIVVLFELILIAINGQADAGWVVRNWPYEALAFAVAIVITLLLIRRFA